MPDAPRIVLFCEDRAGQALVEPLLLRIGAEVGCQPEVRVVSALGGYPRALDEFDSFLKNEEAFADADLLVAAIDGNCTTFARKREEIRQRAPQLSPDRLIPACLDPHIERWYLADPGNARRVIGATADLPRNKCERSVYRKLLNDTIRQAGHGSLDGAAFAEELAEGFDLYLAGKNDRSFGHFVDELRSWFRLRRAATEP